MRTIVTAVILLFALPPVLAFPVRSGGDATGPSTPLVASQQSEESEREPGPASLEEAIEIAVKRYGGEPAGAATVERDGRRVHEVRLLDEASGSVRTVRIDPDTGAIIPPPRR
jgi:uncharacterized iron-regulated membrane protein